MIILDSDIVIDVQRRHPPAIEWLDSLDEREEVALSGYVVMELVQGCNNKADLRKLEKLIDKFEIIWPTQATCDEALEVFSEYKLSHNLGLLDTLIGQTAVALGLPLYTFNRKHYAPIPKLVTVQPYEK